ncbi:MAG: sigma-54 dependent transcriptional regulator [Thermodesulfobacteriota bacterium]|nr:sigma-54 dependent transcriptional regulator [Thermodesulfobacteriota bacterium]
MARILIIDDDPNICDVLARMVEKMGHEARYVHTLSQGLSGAEAEKADVIFLDVRMPDGNGLDILPNLKKTDSEPEVIIITGMSDPNGAELAIKNGAWDYIPKGTSVKGMTLSLTRALQYREEKKTRYPIAALKREGIIGNSPKMNTCFDLLAQVAGADTNVLISGETGTGKELFAWAIHNNSRRAQKQFVVVDCATLPENLTESIIFGHEKGAFTDANTARDGLIRQADGGTLFLDEVGELPLRMQKAFLRVLQEHRFRPLGGEKEIKSDFRLIAATNKNLDNMVQAGQFRKDLVFRLRSHQIHVPPLRERLEDLRDLVLYHIVKLTERYGLETKGVSPDFLEDLCLYDWPGNVRELVNVLETSLTSARGAATLFPTHLPTKLRVKITRASVQRLSPGPLPSKDSSKALPRLREARQAITAEFEKQYLQDLMTAADGGIKEACRISGVSRQHLYELLKKHNLRKRKQTG